MSRSPQKLSGSRTYREAWRAINLLIRSNGSWSGRERDVCYRNLGDGHFEDTSFVTGLDSAGDGRAFVTLDWNNDGALDLALMSRTAPRLQLFQNQPTANGLIIELSGNGGETNRDAIGAVAVLVTSRGRQLLRHVQAGSGYLSQPSRRLHFAMEPGETPRELQIDWPGGSRQVLRALPPRGTVRLQQGTQNLVPVTTPVHVQMKQEAAPATVWLQAPLVPPAMEGLRAGKYTLLNFWASWCPPCRQEMAEWTRTAAEFQKAGLDVVVASVDEDKTKRPAAPFPVLQPTERQTAAWNLFHRHLFDWRQDIGLPSSFLLDEAGRVVKVYKGVAASTEILRDLLSKDRPAVPFPGKWHGPLPERDYAGLATAFAEHGLLDESTVYFELATSKDNVDADALNNYAAMLLEAGDLRKAEDLLMRTLTKFPRQLDALANLAVLRLKQSQPGAARDLFRQVLDSQADDASTYNGLGSALFALSETAAARQAFAKAVELDGGNAEYRKNLGSALATLGDHAAALREFEMVRRAMPDSAAIANSLGILYVETGDIARGEAEFRRAIALAAEDDGGYLNLATLYVRSGKRAEAREVLGRLLERRPMHARALQLLKDLP